MDLMRRPSPSTDEFDELLADNRTAFLRNIADELRQHLPLDSMLPSESTAYRTVPETRTGLGPGHVVDEGDDDGVFHDDVADAATPSANSPRGQLPVR